MHTMTAHVHAAPDVPRSDERLAKRVAAMLTCSRREAEQYIAGGWVRVDGQVVEEPQFRVLQQKVEIDRDASLMGDGAVTLLLHKPADCADAEPALALLRPDRHMADDPSGVRVLKRHFVGLNSLVALETGASGLLVFSQDWRVVRKLTEDADLVEHEVIVEIEGQVSSDALERLNRGLSAEAKPLPRVRVSLNSGNETSSKLRFAVKGSHPGLLAYLCERLGLKILGMKRLRVGRVAMGQLPLGQWRYLQSHERF
jgi:23S rRNA pseudouridine2604 synthase